MNPGKELDALIAEKVMGLIIEKAMKIPPEPTGVFLVSRDPFLIAEIPRYSTDIAAAWEVVEKLRHRNFSFTSHNDSGMSGSEKTEGKGWLALFHIEGGPMAYTYGETAPHAICLAALNAFNVEVKE